MGEKINKIYNSVFKIITTRQKPNYEIPYLTEPVPQSIGAGFFFSKNGYAITAAHVIENSVDLWIQIPSQGKNYFSAEIISVYPDFDLAIIKINFNNKEYLILGNSDSVSMRDTVYTIGYPNNPEYPKVTTGTISGHTLDFIQSDTAVNPGNSGGPLLDQYNQVVGVLSAVIRSSDGQRSDGNSLITPINYIKKNLDELLNSKSKILYKNVLGLVMKHNSEYYKMYHKIPNKCKQGIVVHYVLNKSPFYNIIDNNDILCNISYHDNSYDIDDFGEIEVDWSPVKISINSLVKRCGLNETIKVKFFSLKKKKIMTKSVKLKTYNEVYPIKMLFLPVDKLDYEIFGGMILMNLTLNHLSSLKFKGLSSVMRDYDIFKPQLVVTYIFRNSKLAKYNSFSPYTLITKINNIKSNSLNDFRKNIKKTIQKHGHEFILIENHNKESAILTVSDLINDNSKLNDNYGIKEGTIQNYFKDLFQ